MPGSISTASSVLHDVLFVFPCGRRKIPVTSDQLTAPATTIKINAAITTPNVIAASSTPTPAERARNTAIAAFNRWNFCRPSAGAGLPVGEPVLTVNWYRMLRYSRKAMSNDHSGTSSLSHDLLVLRRAPACTGGGSSTSSRGRASRASSPTPPRSPRCPDAKPISKTAPRLGDVERHLMIARYRN